MLSDACGPIIGRVSAISVQRVKGAAPVRVDEARLVEGLGIDGDAHADDLSLRQVLIADAAAYAELGLPAHALRENLLFTFEPSTLASGTLLRVGGEALVWLTFRCEACGELNKHRAGLSKAIGQRRGMLARVARGGTVREGDAVVDLGRRLAAWSDDWRERVRTVLSAVPPGLVVEYSQLARLAGVSTGYCRAFPPVIRGFGAACAEKAVPRQAIAGRERWDGAGLFDDQYQSAATLG